MRFRPVFLIALALALAAFAPGCGKKKLGEACTLDSAGPKAGTNRLIYAVFECESEICVSMSGAASYCTQECTSCPSGYSCRTDVLITETGNACSASAPCSQAYTCTSAQCAPKGYCIKQ
ncbi:MAG: hypothetical protein HYY84_09270 [Deltaproteobacteria bacterium]|nr:hypothetical protein [Deltaproteobacteria bacterium]